MKNIKPNTPKKIILWIVGLFVALMVIGSIGVATSPGGWDAAQEQVKQDDTTKASAKAQQQKEAADQAKAQEAADQKAKATEEKKRKAEEAQAVKESKMAEAKAEKEQKAQAAAEKKAHPFKAVEEASGVKGLSIHQEGNIIFAKFPVVDNMTKNMIRTGAQTDTLNILKAIQTSDAAYSRVFVQGTFPMQDQYGNTEDSIILNVGYTKEIVDKINFENMLHTDIWTIHDNGMIHPELQD